jgi:putative ABC transport system substrate-binding protein
MDFAARNVDVTATAADFLFVSEGEQLSRLAVQYTVPVLCVLAQSVRTGGSMSYAPSTTSIVYQAWLYAGRILKGEKPADLPVLLPTKFELVINLKTAKALGIQVPEALLATADEVLN